MAALFDQFNPDLGTLQSVTIQQSGSISSDIKVQNTSSNGTTENITATVAGTIQLGWRPNYLG